MNSGAAAQIAIQSDEIKAEAPMNIVGAT